MLRIIQTKSAGGAKSYYSQADYLSEGQELSGKWYGKAAALLGLQGNVEKQDFDRLCDNQHPATGERLTQRNSEGRTVGYDFNFHVPKGVSLAYELLNDDRILNAFERAVDETMELIEENAATRIRKHSGNLDRNVGNLAWAKFVHRTARPVDGVPDPHLHAHAFVFNSVFDEKENEWKAGQFRNIKRDAPYFEAVFHSKLARFVKDLGYDIERRGKRWDLAQVPESITSKFSRRTELIEALVKEKGVTDLEKKSELGASSREGKQSNLTMPELKQLWWARLNEGEKEHLQRVVLSEQPERTPNRAAEAVSYSLEHCFERRSVVPVRELIGTALRFGVGDVSVDEVKEELASRNVLSRNLGGRELATTAEVLRQETNIVARVKDGVNSQMRFVEEYEPKREWLNEDQRNAIQRLLGSTDLVSFIKGGAGTGKTTLMAEAIEAMESAGHSVYTFAPSAEASRGVLASEGFKATTVAELLVSMKLQEEVSGSVLWIDEAGLLSSKQLDGILAIAERGQCRIVLSGDPNQHKSVERGDILQNLERENAIQPIRVDKIERQKGEYKQAVEHFSRGDIASGFNSLSDLGWIHEQEDTKQRLKTVANDYANDVQNRRSTLIVSPTHAEANAVTMVVREELQSRKLIGKKSRTLQQLKPVHLTVAERSDSNAIHQGDYLAFHQNVPGIKRGTCLPATTETIGLAVQYPERFSVYRESAIELSKGDKIRITRSGKTLDGKHRIYNGNTFEIEKFDREGNIVLQNGWKIDKGYGHIQYGYVSTSHASQGKTVDHVMIVESAQSFPAAGRDQMYVSVSRGRQKASIYTDSFEALQEAVQRTNERMSASELIGENKDAKRTRHQKFVKGVENEHQRQQKRTRELVRE